MNRFTAAILGTLLLLLSPSSAAQPDMDELWNKVSSVMQPGPVTVSLGSNASVDVPAQVFFIPRPVADEVMQAYGNQVGPDFLGLLMPLTDEDYWFATLEYVQSGYITDDDARDWDTDELYDSLVAGTNEGNKFRNQRGIPGIELTGWVEEPRYDASKHQLVWSAGVKQLGMPPSPDDSVNYNTYVLGRRGYISLNFVSGKNLIEQEKPIANQLLAATRFDAGERYGDFNEDTDDVAGYGLAALVGGVAAKKLGLLALIGVFLLKAWKLLLVGVVGVGAIAARIFKSKKDAQRGGAPPA